MKTKLEGITTMIDRISNKTKTPTRSPRPGEGDSHSDVSNVTSCQHLGPSETESKSSCNSLKLKKIKSVKLLIKKDTDIITSSSSGTHLSHSQSTHTKSNSNTTGNDNPHDPSLKSENKFEMMYPRRLTRRITIQSSDTNISDAQDREEPVQMAQVRKSILKRSGA